MKFLALPCYQWSHRISTRLVSVLSFSTWHMVLVAITIFIVHVFGTMFKVKNHYQLNIDSLTCVVFLHLLHHCSTTFVIPMLIQGYVYHIFSYISASPFITQHIYGMSPQQFSIMFAVVGISLIVSSQLTGKLIYKQQMLLLNFY